MAKPGKSSGKGGGGGSKSIPKINNPAGIPSNAMTEDEFLRAKGVGSPVSDWVVDKVRGNRQLRTQRGEEKFQREFEKAESEYQAKRQSAKQEYKQLISQGKIRDKTSIEKMITTAHGNPDNASVQAARRMAERRGINWRTGKKLKNK